MSNNDQTNSPEYERGYGQQPPPHERIPQEDIPTLYPPQDQGPPSYIPQDQGPQSEGFITGTYGKRPQDKLRGQPPERKNGWKLATIVLLIITVILLSTTVIGFMRPTSAPPMAVAPTATPMVPQTAPPATPTGTATLGLTATSGTTQTATPTSDGSQSPANYSALQPGPGCDKNGGTWTPQGFSSIACGTQLELNTSSTGGRGYLFLQLPNNSSFSPNNKIGVIGGNIYNTCFGLDEQDANAGFLAEYCVNGQWAIYTISSDGTIVQTLDKNITSTRSSADLTLTLKGSTLAFSIDNEIHTINSIKAITPTRVAITDSINCNCGNGLTVNNFSYTVLSN